MKKILLVLLLFSLSVEMDSQTQLQTIINKNNEHLFKNLIRSKGKFHMKDVGNNLYLVFDTISNNNYYQWNNTSTKNIIGFIRKPTNTEFHNLRTLNPQNMWSDIGIDTISMYKINENTLIIPMNDDEESTLYTNWKILENDTIQFINCITPNIWTKYATSSVIDHHYFNNKLYLLCKNIGGEGGENWESFWIAEYNGVDNYAVKFNTGIGSCHDCGDWAKITYKINKDTVEVYETRDSMIVENQQWKLIKSDTKQIQKIKLY